MTALTACALLLWAPGTAVLAALRLPLRWAAVLAPGITAGLVGAGAWLGLPWGLPAAGGVLGVAVLLAAVLSAGVLRSRVRGAGVLRSGVRGAGGSGAPPSSLTGPALALAGGGVVLAGAVLALVLARAGTPLSGVNQMWDAAWHANLTTWALATGDASPAAAGDLFGAGWRDVDARYPSGMHALAALVVAASGTGVVEALHAVVLVHAVLVLPAAVAAVTWEAALRAGAGRPAAGLGAGTAAVVAVLPEVFPLDHVWRPAWPTAVAFTLVVVTAAAALRWARTVRDATAARTGEPGAGRAGGARPGAALAAVTALCLLGTAAVHPTGAVALALAAGVWVLGRALLPGRWRAARAASGAGLVVLAALGSWAASRSVPAVASLFSYDYRTLDSPWRALGLVLGLSVPVNPGTGYAIEDAGPQLALTAASGAALVVVMATPGVRWVGALWLLLVAAAADTVAPVAPGLHLVTGWFFNGQTRLGALVALVGAVTTGVAVARCAPWLARRGWVAVTASVLGLAALAGTAVDTAERARPRVAAAYADRVVGPDQEGVMRELAALPLPPGGRVLGDPLDGSAWLYTVTGTLPLFTHYEARRPTGAAALLLERLGDVDADPGVRAALEELRVCYVYAGGASVLERIPRSAGFAGLDDATSLELVARAGRASAYRVVPPVPGC